MSDPTEAMGKPVKPPPKKPGRKKVAKKNLAHQPKSRGRYISKQAKQLTKDVAECIFSDEEERKEYVHQAVGTDSEGSVVLSSDTSEVESSVVSSSDGHESSTVLSDSSLSTTPGSRPSSSLSRPGSSLDTSAFDSSVVESINNDSVTAPPDLHPSVDFVQQGYEAMQSLLPSNWLIIFDDSGFHFLEVSSTCPQTVRKEIFISFGGNVLIYVHCVLLPSFQKLFGLPSNPPVELREETFSKYCDYCISLVKRFYQFQVCVGANDAEAREVWTEIGGGYIDSNPFREENYVETYRSASCSRLVDFCKGKRCSNCSLLMKAIAKRKSFLLAPVAAPSTSNKYLSKQQANAKLELQSEIIRKKEKQIAWLRKRYQQILEAEGCNIDEDVSNFFSNVLSSSNLSQSQQMFLNEQWAASNKSDSRAHRWHPAMIRFALHLHMVSSAAYETLRDSGLIKLPCARTLFDYSHAIKATTGVNERIVKLVHNDVVKFTEPYKHYHNLLCDGMHVSQNLVLRSSDGSLVGVTYFDEIDKEMEVFEKYVEGKNAVPSEPQLATEMLAFMVKGVASHVKCLIAAFPCKILTKEMLYKRAWEVINICEKAGIKILSFICDGHSVNRAFINMHTPITNTASGIVFDTVNVFSPDLRPLYFLSDVCHLLKTIRNCFFNSGEGKKKTRLLQINGETIEWKTIVRLYLSYKDSNFRKSYKLNPQNVFPSPFARMRVRYAAQVLSTTVANDLESQNWEHINETIKFIRLCDKFFDVLNGAHSAQANRLLEPDLAAYESLNDPRFDWLENTCLKYFQDWKVQVESKKDVDAATKERMMLSHQTLLGIEITVRSFIAAVKLFLDPNCIGGKFIMARIFSQDPLEQEFSKQRAGGGGNRNPNVSKFQSKMVSCAIQRNIGISRKRGNVTAEGKSGFEWSDEPLMKRVKTKK